MAESSKFVCPKTEEACVSPRYCVGLQELQSSEVHPESLYGEALVQLPAEVTEVMTTSPCAEERQQRLAALTGDATVSSLTRYEALRVMEGVHMGQVLFMERTTD
jgi:hypothetical protein